MIQQRNLVTLILLNLVTCGIYNYYFMYTMSRDINTMTGDDGQKVEPGMAIVLTIVTCGIYTYFWYYKQGNRIKALADRNNIPCQENGSTYLMWILFGVILCGIGSLYGMYLFIKNFNALATAYNASISSTYVNNNPTA